MTTSVRLPNTSTAEQPSHVLRPRTNIGCALWLIGRISIAVALVALLVMAAQGLRLFVEHGRIVLDYPYSLNYGEGPLLDQVARLSRGENLYPRDLSQPPYTITNYPPVYMLAQVPFMRAFGAEFWYGRLISLAASVFAALMIAGIAAVTLRDGIAALAASLMFLCVPYILHWSALARIDSLALALSLTGLFFIAWKPERQWAVMLSLVFLTAAAYTRQTYLLAAPLAACAWLWGRVSPLRGITFGIQFVALVLAIFIPLLVITRGGIFFHLITANVNALDNHILDFFTEEILHTLPILLAGGGLWLVGGWISRSKAWWLIGAYLLGGFAVALTITKVGSDVNYLYELMAALCLAAAALIAVTRRFPIIKAALIAAVAVQMAMALGLSEAKYYRLLTERIDERRAGMALLEQVIASTDSPIITDEHMGLLALAGKPIYVQPFEMSQLAIAGQWDQTPFLEAMERGEYPVVLMYNPMMNPQLRMERWTREMRRVISDYYRVERQAAETLVYRYQPR